MLIMDRPIGVVDQPTPEMVAALLESWSIEEVRRLIEEIEAEIARRTIH
jgi:hypothetical protein